MGADLVTVYLPDGVTDDMVWTAAIQHPDGRRDTLTIGLEPLARDFTRDFGEDRRKVGWP